MAMYFDVSVHKYYKALQKAQDAGLIAKTPMQQLNGTEPLVAVWIGSSRALEKTPLYAGYPKFSAFGISEHAAKIYNYG